MNTSQTSEIGVPIEHFVQALTSQLDRAQAALALKLPNLASVHARAVSSRRAIHGRSATARNRAVA